MKKIQQFLTQKNILLIVIIILVSMTFISSYDCVISNSEDWQDIYSIMLYGRLQELKTDFILDSNISKGSKDGLDVKGCLDSLMVSKRNGGYINDYMPLINNGYSNKVEEIKVKDSNLVLIQKLPEIKNFIIIDEKNSDNLLTAFYYAVKEKAWVFIFNDYNDEEILRILRNREVDNILLYGYVNEGLQNNLNQYNLKIINNDNKYLDNVEILQGVVGKELKKQVFFIDKSFMEYEMFQAKFPVILIGDDMPDDILQFLTKSKFEVGVGMGVEYIDVLNKVRKQTHMNVMIKMGRSKNDLFIRGVNLEDDKSFFNREYECQGQCILNSRCYPIGYRLNNTFCSGDLNFVFQKNESMSCDNNFECKSNVCVSGECVSMNLLSKILNWFKEVFGK